MTKPDPKAPAGQTGRFAALKAKLKGKVSDSDAGAETVEPKKPSAKKFNSLASKGK